MALIPRIKIDGDFENRADLKAVSVELDVFAERLGTGRGRDAIAHDKRDAEAMHGVMRAHLQRSNISGVKLHRHNCSHVVGFAEPSVTACTDPQYGYAVEAL